MLSSPSWGQRPHWWMASWITFRRKIWPFWPISRRGTAGRFEGIYQGLPGTQCDSTAEYQTFTDMELALAYLQKKGAPIVVKADGLAAGKGVIVAETLAQAQEAVKDMLSGNKFGDAGHRVVIEDFLEGEEASFIVMVDGEHVLPMATSQDHKRVGDQDTGPNTGGMGAYSPAPVVTQEVHDRIMHQVIMPTVRGMAKEGKPLCRFPVCRPNDFTARGTQSH